MDRRADGRLDPASVKAVEPRDALNDSQTCALRQLTHSAFAWTPGRTHVHTFKIGGRAAAHRFAALVLLSPAVGCGEDCPLWQQEPLDERVGRIAGYVGISESGDIFYPKAKSARDLNVDFYPYANVGVPLYGLANPHPTFLVVGRSGSIFFTTEPHTLWERADTPPVPEDLLAARLSCETPPLGLAVGRAGRILRSVSSGMTWEIADSSTLQDLHALSLGPGGDDDIAVVVGANGTLLRSVDAGSTWSAVETGTTADLFWVDFQTHCDDPSPHQRGYAVGARGTVLVSEDTGISWQSIDLGISENLRQVHLDGQGAKFLGEGRLWHWFPNYKEAWVLNDFGQAIEWYDDNPNRPKAGGDGAIFWYQGSARCPDDS